MYIYIHISIFVFHIFILVFHISILVFHIDKRDSRYHKSFLISSFSLIVLTIKEVKK